MYKRVNDPRFMIPIGSLFLVIALVMQWKHRALLAVSPALGDGAIGVVFGIAIGFMFLGMRANARRVRGTNGCD